MKHCLLIISINIFLLTFEIAKADKAVIPKENTRLEKPNKYEKSQNKTSEAINITNIVNIEEVKTKEAEYSYKAFSLPDPFIPPLANAYKEEDEEEIIIAPLSKYNLAELQLVGIWSTDNNNNNALIITPENEGVICSNGDLIGNKDGTIISIEENLLTVREFINNPDGTRTFSDRKLFLGDEK